MDRNSRLVWLVTAIAVAVVWAVGLWFDRREPRAPTRTTTPAAERAVQLEAARPESGGTAAADPPSPSTLSVTEGAQPPTTPAAHAKSPGQVLPGAFLSETRDAAWATESEAVIRSAFADAQVPAGSLLSVECRRRLCKAEVWFEPSEHVTFGKAYATLRERFGIDVGFHRVRGGVRGESEHVAVYFPRQGYALKDFEGAGR